MAGYEELRTTVSGSVVCPRPRRLNPIRPIRYNNTNPFQSEIGDSQDRAELLDIILTKGRSNNQLASSPPYFCGSPPSRASNPVTQDEQFGNTNGGLTVTATPPSPSARKGGCAARMSFGLKPAAVRIEGFDRRNCGISAVA